MGKKLKESNITFIGAGFMGSALIRGLVKSGAAEPGRITAVDTNRKALAPLADELGIKPSDDSSKAVASADIVVFAVKPKELPAIAGNLRRELGPSRLVISIAAGVATSSLTTWLSTDARIVRAMPNMAAMIGESATAICAGGAADKADLELARSLFNAVGECVIVDESLMDAVTGLSGSGPAFVFMFMEALVDAGVHCGLARDVALTLARQTIRGAAGLANHTGQSPCALKERITSPGGTTIAGIASLENDRFRAAVINAVSAATRKSRELGQ